MKTGTAILILVSFVALALYIASDWPDWSARYDRCMAKGGENYRRGVCYRTKREVIDMSGIESPRLTAAQRP